MSDADAFRADWARLHPNSVPVSHTLKWSERSNWLRFHSLPDGKRYAEDAREAKIVADRARTAGDELMKRAGQIWLVVAKWQPNPELEITPDMPTIDLNVTDPDAAASFRVAVAAWETRVDEVIKERGLEHAWTFPFPDDEVDYAIHVGRTHWPDCRDPALLRCIADDELHALFWMAAETGEIFAPYDGGIDLIMPLVSRRADLRQRYADWLSERVDGL